MTTVASGTLVLLSNSYDPNIPGNPNQLYEITYHVKGRAVIYAPVQLGPKGEKTLGTEIYCRYSIFQSKFQEAVDATYLEGYLQRLREAVAA